MKFILNLFFLFSIPSFAFAATEVVCVSKGSFVHPATKVVINLEHKTLAVVRCAPIERNHDIGEMEDTPTYCPGFSLKGVHDKYYGFLVFEDSDWVSSVFDLENGIFTRKQNFAQGDEYVGVRFKEKLDNKYDGVFFYHFDYLHTRIAVTCRIK